MNEELNIINSALLSSLSEKLDIGSAFNLWFDGLTLISLDDKLAAFSSPSKLRKNVLSARYKNDISTCLAEIIGFEVEIDIISVEDAGTLPKEPKIYDSSSEELTVEKEVRESQGNSFSTLFGIDSDKSDTSKSEFKIDNITTLSQYTFDNFVEGDSNRFAKAACMGVAEEPGFNYNPLFIYGNSGLGKTHLLYATIKSIHEKHPEMKIVFKKCVEFVNELVMAIKQGATDVFRERYHSCDVLLIDDIQFIANKELCQDEFFHLFSSLYEADKQIILTSDRPPNEINPLADRIRSRLEGGILADIKVPGFELRAAIAKKKADAMNIAISDELIQYMAQRLRVNIRQIEGVLKKIRMLGGLSGKVVTKEVVDEAIFAVDPGNMPNDIVIERTLDAVSKKYGISVEDLKSKKRTDSIAKARHVAIYLIKEIIDEISYKEIGNIFGGRDHTTVMASINKVKSDIRTVNGVEEDIKRLTLEIKGSAL